MRKITYSGCSEVTTKRLKRLTKLVGSVVLWEWGKNRWVAIGGRDKIIAYDYLYLDNPVKYKYIIVGRRDIKKEEFKYKQASKEDGDYYYDILKNAASEFERVFKKRFGRVWITSDKFGKLLEKASDDDVIRFGKKFIEIKGKEGVDDVLVKKGKDYVRFGGGMLEIEAKYLKDLVKLFDGFGLWILYCRDIVYISVVWGMVVFSSVYFRNGYERYVSKKKGGEEK